MTDTTHTHGRTGKPLTIKELVDLVMFKVPPGQDYYTIKIEDPHGWVYDCALVRLDPEHRHLVFVGMRE